MLEDILKINDLHPSTKEILSTWYQIGLIMNELHVKWDKYLIKTLNKNLLEEFGTNEKVIKFLTDNNLMDLGHNGEIADRMYSVLIKENGKYISASYKTAFSKEITKITTLLQESSEKLSKMEDNSDILSWKNYFDSLIIAFNQTEVNDLVHSWSKVDEVWMSIKTPIQPGHFFEYYEDKFRSSVAIEWDLRIDDLSLEDNQRSTSIQCMFNREYHSILNNNNLKDIEYIKKDSENNIQKVQLHIGKPLFYFASSYEGLFSAQVIPNDEVVSEAHGKKIFAFPEKGLETAKKRPFLKLSKDIFGEEITNITRRNLFFNPERNFQVYDINTIGHEYGHVLWKTQGSEVKMNDSGNFKNIEEFKATAGGLMAFFDGYEEQDFYLDVFSEVIKRAVSLIGWKKEGPVEPYYCEGLITLSCLFDSNVLDFDEANKKLNIDISMESFNSFKDKFKIIYRDLALTYINLEDASKFLYKYAIKKGKYFEPESEKIRIFADWYYSYQEKYAATLDTETKEEWIKKHSN